MIDIENNRREFLRNLAIGCAGMTVFTAPAQAARLRLPMGTSSYKINFRNQHTGEKFSGTYRVGNRYLPEAFADINHILRDFRTGDEFPIDPRTVDILYMIQNKLDTTSGFEILSGYRSPKTNAMLYRTSSGVAKNSLHMTGQAIDLRLAGFSTSTVRDAARSLKAGGVGYYPKSGFVHVDTGKVRHW